MSLERRTFGLLSFLSVGSADVFKTANRAFTVGTIMFPVLTLITFRAVIFFLTQWIVTTPLLQSTIVFRARQIVKAFGSFCGFSN